MTVELVRALCSCAGDRRRGKARKFLPHSLQAGERLQTANASGQAAARWGALANRRLGLLRLLGQPAHSFPLGNAETCLPNPRGLRALARKPAGFCCVKINRGP